MIVWYAECLDVECQRVSGRVVMQFQDQATREQWAARHEAKFADHHVIRYLRRFKEEPHE
jgi:hypothetical protein